jgi:two-component system osmolarity sensor histidine kinase EnvZ
MILKPAAAPRRAFGLIDRSLLVVTGILALQVVVSLFFYALIQRESLREDHARRVAELLIVSQRAHQMAGEGAVADVGRLMTSNHLEASVVRRPPAFTGRSDPAAEAIRRAMVRWEPSLARAQLSLWTIHEDGEGGSDLHGVMRLPDGAWLTFRSTGQSRYWPTAGRIALMTVMFATLSLAASFVILRQFGKPLRQLTAAASALGRRRHVSVPIEGPAEVRDLGRAFNEMQDRITGLIDDQRRAMEAISHDMRTPLARLQLAAEFVKPADARELVVANVTELDALLKSLSAYLQAQHQESDIEPTDLAGLIREVLSPWDKAARYHGPRSLTLPAHRTALREALVRLVENAVRHGGGAEVHLVAGPDGSPRIEVRDHGPGMSPEDLAQVYEPFFRADGARARNTAGFGLGVPTATRLLRRFGGDLEIANAPDGGLLVSIQPPLAA